MAWVLLTVTGVLAVLVGRARRALRLRLLDTRIDGLLSTELDASRWRRQPPRTTIGRHPATPAAEPEYVITHLGEPEPEPEPVPTVAAPVFADIVLRETVVQAASLVHGVRRALAPETRNRIRFEMRPRSSAPASSGAPTCARPAGSGRRGSAPRWRRRRRTTARRAPPHGTA